MVLDIETQRYIEAKGLPSTEILSVSFLPVDEFYSAAYNNEEYLVVADEDEGMNDIGINKHGNVYLIGLDRKMYVSNSLVKFIKQLLAYQSFKLSVANCSEHELNRRTSEFQDAIERIDKTATKNSDTFWSIIIGHINDRDEM